MPSESELLTYYHSGYRIELGKGKRPSKHRLWRIAALGARRAADLLPRIPSVARTMDVGCGAGELVFMLSSCGDDARGFDPDSHYIDWARRVIGPAVERNSVDTIQIEPSSLDLVTMYHVLEHMRDPGSVVRKCASWLKAGGLMVIEVPNLESTVQAPGHQYQKAHLHYFNETSLVTMGSRAGLRMEQSGAYDYRENLRCYLRKDEKVEPLPLDPDNASHILQILAGHRLLPHYLSTHPYRRVWGRCSRTVSEVFHSTLRTDQQVLGAMRACIKGPHESRGG
jgi:2-polyprenyl-3-methyl-5-hydroxy-6-metoxy-1,4-benzoquinol methylase